MIKKTILIITDGIGHNEEHQANALSLANTPTYDLLFKTVPYNFIATSGLSVGLPEGQMGNSEVGHMSIGSGRILYQNLVKITLAMQEGTLSENSALKHLLQVTGDIHIVGLVSDGGVHSHIEHIMALAKIVEAKGKKVYLHAITDGRDVSPTSGKSFISQLVSICNETIKLASISGRFFSMDRDNRWDRVVLGYRAMVDATPLCESSAEEYMGKMYDKGITDEFIEPVAFEGYAGMQANDGVIFANFRNDRMRELVRAIAFKEFHEFERTLNGVACITMSEYDSSFPFKIMFQADTPHNTLSEVISRAGLSQFHTAETEKYAHVTFFFNGGKEQEYPGEDRILVPSPRVASYAEKPEMSAKEVTKKIIEALMSDKYHFVVVNFANGDMVAHTGDLKATIKAIEVLDGCLKKIIEVILAKEGLALITADHGNAEELVNLQSNDIEKEHSTYPVPLLFVNKKIEGKNGGLP
ncbi:MAG: 2,3-bisphosphoglycerate-independent phosphoglycerate mutase, partial [Sulfurospirillaceae bacterium]|nr:2,3-bisphosphoglycerate-independent phosphoglycerate mutase [Sulfurospirillaceae bacterium]